MQRQFILYVFLHLTTFMVAQPHANLASMAEPEEPRKFNLGLHGKLFGFFVIEDTYVAAANIGMECLLKDRHSFGVSANWLGILNETDDDQDVAMYDQHEKRLYLYADYKYFFLHRQKAWWYFNFYDRQGRYRLWYKTLNYDFGHKDMSFLQSKTNGSYNEPGAGIGVKIFLHRSYRKFGLDLSVNGARRFSKNDILTITDSTHHEFVQGVETNKGIFYLRWNLFYLFR